MGILPEHERALVPIEKLRDYALNPRHPHGKHKAKVFEAILGLKSQDALWLSEQILFQLPNFEAKEGKIDAYGKRYTVDIKIRRLDVEAWVRTGWIFLTGTDYARLTTCFIIRSEEL